MTGFEHFQEMVKNSKYAKEWKRTSDEFNNNFGISSNKIGVLWEGQLLLFDEKGELIYIISDY